LNGKKHNSVKKAFDHAKIRKAAGLRFKFTQQFMIDNMQEAKEMKKA